MRSDNNTVESLTTCVATRFEHAADRCLRANRARAAVCPRLVQPARSSCSRVDNNRVRGARQLGQQQPAHNHLCQHSANACVRLPFCQRRFADYCWWFDCERAKLGGIECACRPNLLYAVVSCSCFLAACAQIWSRSRIKTPTVRCSMFELSQSPLVFAANPASSASTLFFFDLTTLTPTWQQQPLSLTYPVQLTFTVILVASLQSADRLLLHVSCRKTRGLGRSS